MSGIFDQIINYSPPLIVSGTVNYKGTWNASTNNPTLNNPPAASTKGDYYVVSTAGTQFSITFGVGDWIISNGTAWEKVDLTDAVSSVFGRTGAVVGVSTDYSAVGITNTAVGAANPSSGAFTSLSSSSTTTLNGTTIPASKTLVVTTDKLSALAATTSAELAGVISDETGSGALVFATSPTLVTPALGAATATSLTVNDNTTLGSSNSDTVNFNARVASDINPSTDNTYDLGVTGHEWRNLNIDGTANIDSLVADTADINGGTIDGTAIGATTPTTGAFTTLTTLAGAVAATGDALALTLRQSGDGGVSMFFTNNVTNLVRLSGTVESAGAGTDDGIFSIQTATNGVLAERGRFTSTGLNSTAIGATTQATGAFTTLSATGNLTLSAANPSLIGGTNAGSVSIQNPDAGAYISIYGSTHATKANKIEIVGTGGVTLTNGLAVTGSLSATGNVVAFSDSANGNSAFESTFSGTTRNGLDLADSTDTSGVFFGVFRKANGVAIGSITRVTTTDAVVYNTTSDGRLKENLRDFTDSGRLIDSLKPRVFDWKNSDENGKNVVGFVAQEQHAADPIFAHIGAVSVGDEDSETITKQWQRSDSALIPILVAELKSVRARLAALESN